jgi:hypothetical protein
VVAVQRSFHIGSSSSGVEFGLSIPLWRTLDGGVSPPSSPSSARLEGFLVLDIVRELLPPLLHQALIALGDDNPALCLAVAVTVLVGDKAWRLSEELSLG